MTYSGIHQLVYPRHGKKVIGASFIQICKAHSYTPLPILLLHYHCIGQLLKVENLLNSPNLLKLVHLLLYSIKILLK